MFRLFETRKVRVPTVSRKFVVWIQAGIVETACQLAELEKKPVYSAGIAALLHALALLFSWIDFYKKDGQLSQAQAVALKSDITEFFVRAGYRDDTVSQEKLSAFLKPVYDIQASVFSAQVLCADKQTYESVAASICELADISKEKEGVIAEELERFSEKIRHFFLKHTIC